MQLSEVPTDHILVRARTDSEWDSYNFAIVCLSEDWKQQQQKRLEAVKPFIDDYTFQSLNFYDCSVGFYQESDEGLSDAEELLAGKDWVFLTAPDRRCVAGGDTQTIIN